MFRDEFEYMMAEAQAEYEEAQAEYEEAQAEEMEEGDDDWVPGCDSVSSYCEGGYDPMTDW